MLLTDRPTYRNYVEKMQGGWLQWRHRRVLGHKLRKIPAVYMHACSSFERRYLYNHKAASQRQTSIRTIPFVLTGMSAWRSIAPLCAPTRGSVPSLVTGCERRPQREHALVQAAESNHNCLVQPSRAVELRHLARSLRAATWSSTDRQQAMVVRGQAPLPRYLFTACRA